MYPSSTASSATQQLSVYDGPQVPQWQSSNPTPSTCDPNKLSISTNTICCKTLLSAAAAAASVKLVTA